MASSEPSAKISQKRAGRPRAAKEAKRVALAQETSSNGRRVERRASSAEARGDANAPDRTGAGTAWRYADREHLVDEIFAAIPDAPAANGHSAAAEVVRKNKRARARQRILQALESRGEHPIPIARRDEARILVERWAQKGFPDAFPEADDFEERCAQEREVLDAAARGDEKERFAAAERAYREEVVKRHGYIEIRGLQLSARVYQELDMVYVPLHVEERAEAQAKKSNGVKKAVAGASDGRRASRSSKKAGKATASISAQDADVAAITDVIRAMERSRVPAVRSLANHERLYLLGGPGSGKSTLMAYVAVGAARGDLYRETGWKSEPIPFLMPARYIGAAEVSKEDLARAANAEAWFFEEALSRGRALLMVDGLDEAKPEIATSLLRAVTSASTEHSGSRLVVTARPAGRPEAEEPAPEGFSRARLTPMTPEEVASFVDRWCLAAEVSLGKPRKDAETEAGSAAEDLKERISARGAIEKLAQTPLLCSVVCVVHRFLGQRIPARRVALYEAITNVLLYEWDRAKFPENQSAPLGQLDAQAKRALLSHLAVGMHQERSAEWPAERVVACFADRLPRLGRAPEEAESIVAHIRYRHGVLVERSPGMFGFSHLTFQEYLTAMEMVNRHKYDVLLERYQDAWWHEVIALAAGFPGADVEKLIRGLLEADEGDIEQGTMLAAQCLETAIEVPMELRSAVETRVATLVPPTTPPALGTLIGLGQLAGPVLMDRLKTEDASEKAAIAIALGSIGHQPATEILCRLLADSTVVEHSIPLTERTYSRRLFNVGASAAIGIAYLLNSSAEMLPRVLRAVPNACPEAVSFWQYISQQMGLATEIGGRMGMLVQRYREAHPTALLPVWTSRPAARSD